MTPTTPTDAQMKLADVTQADRDLWKYLLDAPKSQCTMMDTCDPATDELQAIARHRQATEARAQGLVEALPCPFCGGTKIRFDEHGRSNDHLHYGELVWSMCCYDCGATFPNMYRKEGLLEKWNTRATEARAQGLVEALEDVLPFTQAEELAEAAQVRLKKTDRDPVRKAVMKARQALSTWRRT